MFHGHAELPTTGLDNSWPENQIKLSLSSRKKRKPARLFKCYVRVDGRFLLEYSTRYHNSSSAHWAEVAWDSLCSAWEISVYKGPSIQHFLYKSNEEHKFWFFTPFSGPAAALTLLPEVQFTVISAQKMNLSLINQYCCFDALHLSRCFTEIPGWRSKKGTPTVNTSPMKCDPGYSFEELLWWLFAVIELNGGFRVQHTASSPGSFLYNTYKWENKITLDCTAAGCRRKEIK